MGLDAYIVERKPSGGDEQLCYFRKFYPLETLCSDIWANLPENRNADKTAYDFNCEYLYLNTKILRKMEKLCYDIKKGKYSLPYPYANTDYVKEAYRTYADYLLVNIPKLWELVNTGADVAYLSWW